MNIISPRWMQDKLFGLSGLGDLSGVYVTTAIGPGGRMGVKDTFGNFYYWTSRTNESQHSQPGESLTVGEDYISATDPLLMAPGVLPWGLPGVNTAGYVANPIINAVAGGGGTISVSNSIIDCPPEAKEEASEVEPKAF